MIAIKCLNCGQSFEVDNYRREEAKFCSRLCRRRCSTAKATCKNCEKEFEYKRYKPKVFCSRSCGRIFSRGERNSRYVRIIKQCRNCGIEFKVKPHQANKLFCSRACRGKFSVGENAPNWGNRKRVSLVCKQCGKDFERTECFAQQKFCSYKCSRQFMVGRQHPCWVEPKYVPCRTCGKQILINKSGVQRKMMRYGKKYCSSQCCLEDRRKNGWSKTVPIGTKSLYTSGNGAGYIYVKVGNRNWVPEHRLIAEQKIGRKLKKNEVAHHIDGNKTNNAPENIMAMNNSEHQQVHHEAEMLGLEMLSWNPDPVGLGC